MLITSIGQAEFLPFIGIVVLAWLTVAYFISQVFPKFEAQNNVAFHLTIIILSSTLAYFWMF